MSDVSNNQGRAYEYIFINTLYDEISKIRNVEIVDNSALHAANHAWSLISGTLQSILSQSAKAAVLTIFDMEPMILEHDDDMLTLAIQTDEKGRQGDVRDIVISRKNMEWEIGLSLKHNHFAVKHSRLSSRLDFGKSWFNEPCSDKYWKDIKPIFDILKEYKEEGKKWNEIDSKDAAIYRPLLQAFLDEVKSSYDRNNNVAVKMVEYLLGEFDFYKVISIDIQRVTQIQSYNLHGTLNRSSKTIVPKIEIPVVSLPTRIVNMDFKPHSNNTIELYMDGGWQFSFRIHNAATLVEPSLKFDIQIVGMPTTIIMINCSWK